MGEENTGAVGISGLVGSWSLDPERTSVTFKTKALWIMPVKASFKAIGGSGTVGEDGSVSGTIILDASSIDTNNKKRDEHLRGSDFFEVSTYPKIEFAVDGATITGASPVTLAGSLTVHGQARPVDVLAAVDVRGSDALVTVEADIDRSEWGVSRTDLGAGLHNHVLVTAVFTRAPS